MRTPALVIYLGVIVPTMTRLASVDARLDSLAARQLLLGTAAHESGGFRHVTQQSGGPGRSLWQIEPATANDVITRVGGRLGVGAALNTFAWPQVGWIEQCTWNQPLACALARLKYWLVPERLPADGDIAGLARYWKQYYNTPLGSGSADDFARAFDMYCRGICDG